MIEENLIITKQIRKKHRKLKLRKQKGGAEREAQAEDETEVSVDNEAEKKLMAQVTRQRTTKKTKRTRFGKTLVKQHSRGAYFLDLEFCDLARESF